MKKEYTFFRGTKTMELGTWLSGTVAPFVSVVMQSPTLQTKNKL